MTWSEIVRIFPVTFVIKRFKWMICLLVRKDHALFSCIFNKPIVHVVWHLDFLYYSHCICYAHFSQYKYVQIFITNVQRHSLTFFSLNVLKIDRWRRYNLTRCAPGYWREEQTTLWPRLAPVSGKKSKQLFRPEAKSKKKKNWEENICEERFVQCSDNSEAWVINDPGAGNLWAGTMHTPDADWCFPDVSKRQIRTSCK